MPTMEETELLLGRQEGPVDGTRVLKQKEMKNDGKRFRGCKDVNW